MVPATTAEGTDAVNGTPTSTTAATIPPASNTPPGNTPHGKDPNGSTSLVTPGARPRIDTGVDAGNTHANTNEEGFISAQIIHLKQQSELANRALAINRILLKKYRAIKDHDSNFLEKALADIDADIDPGNYNNNNNTATANGTGTLTTTAATNGSGNSLTINATGIPNPYSKRSRKRPMC